MSSRRLPEAPQSPHQRLSSYQHPPVRLKPVSAIRRVELNLADDKGQENRGKPEKKSSFPGPDDMINRPEIGQHRTMYPESEEEALAALKGDDPTLAATAEAFLWRIWCRSADAEAGRIFRDGVEAMQRRQLAEAEALFSRVIERDPDFAEGWNKRATVRFLRKDFQGAIADSPQRRGRIANRALEILSQEADGS